MSDLTSSLRAACLVLAGAAVGACGGSDLTGPSGPGLIQFQISVPPGRSDAIALIKITGGTVTAIRPGANMSIHAVGINTETLTLVVRGPLQGTTTLVSACIPKVENRTKYRAAVMQVAAGRAEGYVKRADVTSYEARSIKGVYSSC